MSKTVKPPLPVLLLVLLAYLAAAAGAMNVLEFAQRVLGIPLPSRYFTLDLISAILWAAVSLVWIGVARRLPRRESAAWLYAVSWSTITLLLAVISVLAGSALLAMMPTLLIHTFLVFFGLLPSTKAAFGVPL